ncbi:hypothetical protein [Helicobacter sp. 23-1045]
MTNEILRSAESTPPQTPPARGGAYFLSFSPSLAEGARGWVKNPSLRGTKCRSNPKKRK